MIANHQFWKLTYQLTMTKGCKILDISPDKKHVWLESSDGKNKQIIRLARVEYDWLQALKEDEKRAYQMFQRVKKLIPARKPSFFNVYISTYPPVDLHERLSAQPSETNMRTFFIAEDGARMVADSPVDVFNALGIDGGWEEVPEDLFDEEHKQYASYYRTHVINKQKEWEKKAKSILMHGKPRFTYVLLGVILLMFFLVEQRGGSTDLLTLIEFGAKFNPAIIAGEWWRLFSAMFLHIGFLHLFMNSFALFYLGTAVERMFGTTRFIIIYFIAGLFGSLASFAFNEQVSAGASGAIFGCFGALLYFGLIYRQLFFRTMGLNVLIILAINLVFGFVVPAVDNGAHIGGLVGGFLASAFLHFPKQPMKWRQVGVFLLTAGSAFLLYGYGLVNENKVSSPLLDLQIAQSYLERGEIEEAEKMLTNLLEDGESAHAYFLKGNIHVERGEEIEAVPYYEKALELEENFPEAYYNLTIVYIELERYEEAKEAFQRFKETATPNLRHELEEDVEQIEAILEEIDV